MKSALLDFNPAEYIDEYWHLTIPNRAGVEIKLKEYFQKDLCWHVHEMYPKAPTSHIAKLVGCSHATALYWIKKRERIKQNKIAKAAQRKNTPMPVDLVSTPEEEEAFNAMAANAVQIGGDHYKGKAIQPWDYIASNNLGYLEGNIVKYVSRWKEKNGVEDLEKAQHYLAKLIEVNK